MGFLDSMLDVVGKIMAPIVRPFAEVAKVVVERVGKVVEAVAEGRWSDVAKAVVETIKDLGEQIQRFATEVPKAIEALTGVAIDGVGTILDFLKTGGRLVIDFFKEHPEECLGILTSLATAATAFATGNFPLGVSSLVAGAVKIVRLRQTVAAEHPEIDVAREYPVPPSIERIEERYRDVPTNELDDVILKQNLNLMKG